MGTPDPYGRRDTVSRELSQGVVDSLAVRSGMLVLTMAVYCPPQRNNLPPGARWVIFSG